MLVAVSQWACDSVVMAAGPHDLPSIVLQHVGPEDASLPQLELRSAPVKASAEANPSKQPVVVVVVAAQTLAGLCADLVVLSSVDVRAERTGTFDARGWHCPQAPADAVVSRRISPEVFLRWISVLQREATGSSQLPDALNRVVRMIRSANKLG